MSDTDPQLQVRPSLSSLAGAPGLQDLEALTDTGIIVQATSNDFVARTLMEPAAGIEITNPAGIGGNPTFALADDLAGLEAISGTGLAARTALDTWTTRTLTGPAAGISVSNGNGVSGNPTLALANDLSAVEGLSGTGIAVRTATDTWANRSVAGTSDKIDVSNGDGVSGNPTITISPTYAGQTSITTLGTIATGTWNGTTIGVSKGGTGLTSTPSNGQVPIGNGSGYTLATLTAGSGISITNGAGSITISTSGTSAINVGPTQLANGDFSVFQRGGFGTSTTITADLSNGSASASNASSVTSLSIGLGVSGTGISAGTTIASVSSNTAFTLSANATATGTGVTINLVTYNNQFSGADRWLYLCYSTQRLHGRGANGGGFITLNSAGTGGQGLAQWLESGRTLKLRGKTIAAQVDCLNTSGSDDIHIAILECTGTGDSLGSNKDPFNDWSSASHTAGGVFKSTNFALIGHGTASISSSGYVRVSATGTVSANATNICVVAYRIGTSGSPSFSLRNFDLFEGNTTRDPAPMEPGDNIRECERFFCKSFAIGQQPVPRVNNNQGVGQIFASTTFGGTTERFPCRMHRVPTMAAYNPLDFVAGPTGTSGTARDITNSANRTISFGTPTDNGITAEITSGASADSRNVFHFTADAEIQ